MWIMYNTHFMEVELKTVAVYHPALSHPQTAFCFPPWNKLD